MVFFILFFCGVGAGVGRRRLFLRAGGSQVTIYLTQEQSRHARDALAKAVYAAMFEWVVGRTNECIEAKQAEAVSEDRIFIGLLDIFGKNWRGVRVGGGTVWYAAVWCGKGVV